MLRHAARPTDNCCPPGRARAHDVPERCIEARAGWRSVAIELPTRAPARTPNAPRNRAEPSHARRPTLRGPAHRQAGGRQGRHEQRRDAGRRHFAAKHPRTGSGCGGRPLPRSERRTRGRRTSLHQTPLEHRCTRSGCGGRFGSALRLLASLACLDTPAHDGARLARGRVRLQLRLARLCGAHLARRARHVRRVQPLQIPPGGGARGERRQLQRVKQRARVRAARVGNQLPSIARQIAPAIKQLRQRPGK
jgi:hypothetical protein